MQAKITHLTSAHPRYDTRIFIKMCSSLAKKENYRVSLVVADGKGDESKNSVNIIDVGVVAKENTPTGLKEAIKEAIKLDKKELENNIQKIKSVYNWQEQEKVLLRVYGELK